jgi:hypothetical protein
MGILNDIGKNVVKGYQGIIDKASNFYDGETFNTLTSNLGDFGQNIAFEMDGLVAGIGQNFITGKKEAAFPNTYTNKLFGAPYQLLDSVDMRDPNINQYVGVEYFRHFLAHAPILYIKPGRPKYTAGDDSSSIKAELGRAFQQTNYQRSEAEREGKEKSWFIFSLLGNLTKEIAKDFTFNRGEIQGRMFGFNGRYREYMYFVNYMCRMVAGLMNLGGSGDVPDGAFNADNTFVKFTQLEWQTYRMDSRGTARSATETIKDSIVNMATMLGNPGGNYEAFSNEVKSVAFMVEPKPFEESYNNRIEKSMIESAIDLATESIGAEIQFITGSNVDKSILAELAQLTAGATHGGIDKLGGVVLQAGTGGFMSNLFHGGMRSLTGQKMLYPDIYKSSDTHHDYNFSITLTTPYGDKYNYYMNIIVPLMHLICLAAPRLVTSNSTTAPFVVQAYIPGMCTVQLGMIKSLNIIKNPNNNHVSIDGFPLTIKVEFQIQELYNAMAISPAIDPSSFIYNETLNDYLANAAGLVPSADMFALERGEIFEQIGTYFSDYVIDDITDIPATYIQDLYY